MDVQNKLLLYEVVVDMNKQAKKLKDKRRTERNAIKQEKINKPKKQSARKIPKILVIKSAFVRGKKLLKNALKILPPSSAGKGRRLNTPRFTVITARIRSRPL